MRIRPERLTIAIACVCVVLALLQDTTVRSQVALTSSVKIYRGDIGGQHIEMKLKTDGKKISGTYSYDHVGQDLKLSGQLDAQGKLQLAEFDATGKQTGRFICEREPDLPDTDSDCKWSKPDGTGETDVTLAEQHLAFHQRSASTPEAHHQSKDRRQCFLSTDQRRRCFPDCSQGEV